MDLRELHGLELAARSRIPFKNGAWLVPAKSRKEPYRVVLSPEGDACPCEDFALTGGKPCKHVHAARLVRERDHGGRSPAIDLEVVPRRPTYKQNWPAYNLAQSTEGVRFRELLHDLCRAIPEPPKKKWGRARTPLCDRVFTTVLKVYSGFSSRRFSYDLSESCAKGYLSKSFPGIRTCAFLNEPDLTPILREFITRTSLPLRAVETTFAPDSTGFSASRFVRWYDEKYGITRSGKDWVKAHAMVGVKTHIITAVEIAGRDANDCPMFKPLVAATAAHFTVKEVTADKGYVSADNLDQVHSLGGTAYIPFRSNSTPGEPGSLWERMFHFYHYRRDEFLKFYHARSNAESAFSAIKAKFRDHVRSKTDLAMKNEVFCKCVCYNICVCIQSQCELGIEPEFWPKESGDGRQDVLPLVRPV